MSRWGCAGLVVGSLVGLVLASLLIWSVRPETPVVAVLAEPVSADVALFLSERSASRFASQALPEPALINFEPGGQIVLTTQVNLAGLAPLVDLGLSIQAEGTEAVSQLHWLQLGWVRIPARWLPPELTSVGAKPGQALMQHVPPQFSLVGLTTSSQGINLQLQWQGE